MPNIFKRLQQQLVNDRGMTKKQARNVAKKTLQDSGSLYRGTTVLTPKGHARTAMGAKGRAIDRAAKRLNRPESDFTYSKKTNRATVKK
jgi:hypothetical protein